MVFLLTNIPLVCLIAVLLYVFFFSGKRKSSWELLARLLLFFPVGIGGIWRFIIYTFFLQSASESLRWAESPFAFQVAIGHLAIGIGSLVASRKNYEFCQAQVLIVSVYYFCSIVYHLYDIFAARNWSPGNADFFMTSNILTPIFLILAMVLWKRWTDRSERWIR